MRYYIFCYYLFNMFSITYETKQSFLKFLNKKWQVQVGEFCEIYAWGKWKKELGNKNLRVMERAPELGEIELWVREIELWVGEFELWVMPRTTWVHDVQHELGNMNQKLGSVHSKLGHVRWKCGYVSRNWGILRTIVGPPIPQYLK